MTSLSSIDKVSGKNFDYIVVGGGTAGLTLAAQLTEDPAKVVLVLEAGAENLNDPAILRSASYDALHGKPEYDWAHRTTNQAGIGGRSIPWARGKGLGGSTAINFLCWSKPPARDIDELEQLGNPGWNWKTHERLLKTVEKYHPPSTEIRKKMQLDRTNYNFGTDGVLDLTFSPFFQDDEVRCAEGFENGGVQRAARPFDGDPNGWFWIPDTYNPETHSRSYAVTAFYLPIKDRPNLFVLTNAQAHRVLTEPSADGTLIAVGVEFGHGDSVHKAWAAKEVVLCAGALKSPQILELSGIGRKDVLERIGVPLKLELPGVGENMQEHAGVGISWELKDDTSWQTLDLLYNPDIFAENLELLKEGKGLFTMGITLLAFFTLATISGRAAEIYTRAKDELEKIDPQTVPASFAEQVKLQLARMNPATASPTCEVGVTPGFWSGPNPPTPGKRYITPMPLLNSPFSRGTIHAVSSNPLDDPEIDPHYLERNVDAEQLVEIIKWTRSLANVSPLKDMIEREVNPGPEVQTDEQILEWAKAHLFTVHHTSSTASMLPREKGGVVDANLKVYGTTNLRVADMSILPLSACTHTASTAYFIGLKAAEVIAGSA